MTTSIQTRLTAIYLTVLTAALIFVTVTRGAQKTDTFDEITVHRINVTEPDGKLRLVISNRSRLPGVMVRGREGKPNRPYAGMIFYNDEETENGGLIFAGHQNANGQVESSGASLSFDKYGDGQFVQLAGVSDKEDRFSGLRIWENGLDKGRNSRVWVGEGADGIASMALMDGNGRKRIVMEVKPDGASSLTFLDENGKVVNQLLPSPASAR
jgi:hypothetical protein